MTFHRTVTVITLALSVLLCGQVHAQDSYKIAWSIYVGWMPWGYAQDAGIIDKWASKYGIEIELVQFNDYVESINQYTAGEFDGCTMTNMDALTIPAAGGVDSTALIVGDFSNGNDAIVLKDAQSLADIKGQNVNLVELSVSHYVLARALSTVGLSERDVRVVNTSDADMVAAFTSSDVTAVVTWNPLLGEVTSMPGANTVFDSSMIPGEIIDLMVINTETARADPRLGKALTGAWYETMALMASGGDAAENAKTAMAEASGTDLAGYEAQLAATQMFYDPAPAVEFVRSPVVQATMEKVAEFSFDHGLLGDGAPDSGVVGIAYPSGKISGSSQNVKLRFDDTYMNLAARGELQGSYRGISVRIINRRPASRVANFSIALLPFVVLIVLYAVFSDIRLTANPDDKLLPGVSSFVDAVQRMAFTPSKRTGEFLLWVDTLASLQRLAIGMSISALLGLWLGVLNGLIPWVAAGGSPFVRVLSMIPPMAVLPILFITFGLGELSKYVLIVFGTAPFIARDIEQRVRELPPEQLIKAQTLDANTWQIIVRVVLPQVLPRLVDAVRLSLGAAWLFLIAAEAIASTEGLGYRIFLVRRYLAMDVILPYVMWITLLAFAVDYLFRRMTSWLFPWYGTSK